jgi:quinol monooxygenase YgiN
MKTNLTVGVAMMVAVMLGSSLARADSVSETLDKGGFPLLAFFTVKEGQREAFIKLMQEVIENSRKEPGAVDYRSYQSPDSPLQFVNFEVFKDKEAFDAHLNTPHVKKALEAFKEILAKDVEVKFLRPEK